MAARVIFYGRNKSYEDLIYWLNNIRPSRLKASDGIEFIHYSPSTKTDPDADDNNDDNAVDMTLIKKEWEELTNNPSSIIRHETLVDLARRHGYFNGKWMFYLDRQSENVDETWRKICKALYMRRVRSVTSTCISTVNDVKEKHRHQSDGQKHVVCLYTRDFTDERDVRSAHDSIRNIPIINTLMYKADIYTVLGIYGGNIYNLRPSIYISESQPANVNVISLFDKPWYFQRRGGSSRFNNLTTPDHRRRGEGSWSRFNDLTTPDRRRGEGSGSRFNNLTTPDHRRRGEGSWSRFNNLTTPDHRRRGEGSWSRFNNLTTPDHRRRGEGSWSRFNDLTTPDHRRRGEGSWSRFNDLTTPDRRRRGEGSWSRFNDSTRSATSRDIVRSSNSSSEEKAIIRNNMEGFGDKLVEGDPDREKGNDTSIYKVNSASMNKVEDIGGSGDGDIAGAKQLELGFSKLQV